ncbi:MAG: nucleotidyl transferase AbiEii/AbiGii toxin family protein [bacterium]
MEKDIINCEQEKFLKFFATVSALRSSFYFTGGTALSHFYLKHRFSEDLDFFSEKEFDVKEITPFLRKGKKLLDYKTIDFQQSFNRNLFYFVFTSKKALKVEFTYFPFPQIEKPKLRDGLSVDSLRDIAVNKVFAINQNPRGRDFFDLYFILKKENWDILELLKQARNKFDWQVDPFHFANQLFKIRKMFDDPILAKDDFDLNIIKEYFIKLSKEIGNKAIKK